MLPRTAAVLVVLFPTVVAPSHKNVVVWTAFIGGVAVAVGGVAVAAVLGSIGFYAELASAIVAGAAAVYAVSKWLVKDHDA